MSLQPPSLRSKTLFSYQPRVLPSPPSRDETQGGPSAALSPSDLLRPHSIGGVFDLAFDIYRAHFRALVTIFALLLLPTQALLYLVVNLWFKPLVAFQDAHADDAGAALLLVVGGLFTGVPEYGIPGLLSLLALGVVSAPIAVAIAEVYRGRVPSASFCYRHSLARIPRVLCGWGIVGLAVAAVLALSFALLFVLIAAWGIVVKSEIAGGSAAVVAALAVLAPYMASMTLVASSFGFTAPLVVLEDTPVTLIPSRNRQLTERPRSRRVWAALVFLPIVFFTVQGLMLVGVSSLLSLFTLWPTLRFCIETTLTALLIALLQPYLLIFLNVLYFDCRIQREALDIHLLAARHGGWGMSRACHFCRHCRSASCRKPTRIRRLHVRSLLRFASLLFVTCFTAALCHLPRRLRPDRRAVQHIALQARRPRRSD